MKGTGIVRRIDELGRIVIPKEIRRNLQISTSNPIEIFVDDTGIILKPCKLQCVCCGNRNEESLKVINGVHLCPECIEKFSRIK